MKRPTLSIIVCAAGAGSRAGFDKNKLLVPFQGVCALSRVLAGLQLPFVDEILVAVNPCDEEAIRALCAPYGNVKLVYGGATRAHTVYNALRETTGEIVLIHDGARPFFTREIIENCYQSVVDCGSGICAIPATDTVAIAGRGNIVETPNRKDCYLVQTPQGFFTEKIKAAYEQAFANGDTNFTDDSSLYAKYVEEPRICAGAKSNVKLTYAEDFNPLIRVGFGVDTHAFGKEQDYIVLGGVKIPSHSGLIAHSDGDVLLHAVMDALLSAAALKDIGHYFPDTEEKFKGADSTLLTKEVVRLLHEKGYEVHNLSVSIHAEKPRLAKYVDEMRRTVASLLTISDNAVGIAAGTNEGLGYVGEGKGITVYAYASIKETR